MVSFAVKKVFANKTIDLSAKRKKCTIICALFGIFFNFILFLTKIIAGALSGSIAIESDAFNNLSDASTSVMALLGAKLSNKKPDPEHPFGHGRMEYLTGLFISLLIFLMGFELAKESFSNIFNPTEPDHRYLLLSIIILLFSIGIKFYMWFYNDKFGKKIESSTLRAIATDSLTDVISTGAILIASIIRYYTNWASLDGICGFIVSLFILFAGYQTAKNTIAPLLGQAPSPELISEIETVVLSHQPIIGIHDLVVHDYGPGRTMISLHAEVPCDYPLSQIHDVIDNAESALKANFCFEATIHCDPIDTKNPHTLELKEDLLSILSEISPEISMHDFRVVLGKSHTNLIFDLLIPFDFSMSEEALCEKVRKEILKKHPHHFCVIQIDFNYANKI